METAIYLLGGAAMVSLLFAIIIAGRKVNEDINIKIQSGDFNKNIHWHFKRFEDALAKAKESVRKQEALIEEASKGSATSV